MPGLSVLVTRPEQQAAGLISALAEQGWAAMPFSTLKIQPLPIEGAEKQKLFDLDRYSVIICVSANAAMLGMEQITDLWPQIPVQQTWVAVGPASAAALAEWGVTSIVPPTSNDSEGLLSLSCLQTVADQKILILRGRGGRELIAKALRSRGATVDYLELYERSMPDTDLKDLVHWLENGIAHLNVDAEAPNRVVTATSGDALKHLLDMVEGHVRHTALKEALLKLPAVVVSERLREYAHSLGFQTIWVAEGASNAALVKCIGDHLHYGV